MSEATDRMDRMTAVALELMKMGVSGVRISELLNYDIDLIERQLAFLPYRKAKRPEAFIIEAIRNNYSAPKEFYHAHVQANPEGTDGSLDEDAEPTGRSGNAEAA